MVGPLRRIIRDRGEKLQTYTLSLGGMHVYDSIIVFDKAVVMPPSHKMTGVPSFALSDHAQQFLVPQSEKSG
jgi:hypothetical protein